MFSSLIIVVAVPILAECVDRWLGRAGWSKKQLAMTLDYEQPYLSRVLSGEKNLPLGLLLERIASTPKALRALGETLIELSGGEAALTLSQLRAELDARHVGRMLRIVPQRKEGVA